MNAPHAPAMDPARSEAVAAGSPPPADRQEDAAEAFFSDAPGLLASRAFWIGGAASIAVWTALAAVLALILR